MDTDRALLLFWNACPELAVFHERLASEELPSLVLTALVGHLADPSVPAAELARRTGCPLSVVRHAYHWCQTSRIVSDLASSAFYPYRLRYAFAAATVREWAQEPERFERLLAGQPVLSRTVEIHPSKGTCNYSCAMCLWSDKKALTYTTQALEADGLLTTGAWLRVLRELRAGGAATLVLSGGGEALLNRDVPTIMAAACALGFRVRLYTTGFNLHPHDTDLWAALLGIDQVRFSIHSPFANTYDAITGLPNRLNALARVVDHITSLLQRRARHQCGPRVGIGFVIQPRNHDQIQPMARFAAKIGVDYLDLRKDEVDVAEGLTPDQLRVVCDQLNAVRGAALHGEYGSLVVDFSDELVSLANGQRVWRGRMAECRAKYFRPTISPFGILAPCDLKAEPRFADSRFNLGMVSRQPVGELVASLPDHFIPDRCAQCMPSSRTGNAVYAKLLADWQRGLGYADQPFFHSVDTNSPAAVPGDPAKTTREQVAGEAAALASGLA